MSLRSYAEVLKMKNKKSDNYKLTLGKIKKYENKDNPAKFRIAEERERKKP